MHMDHTEREVPKEKVPVFPCRGGGRACIAACMGGGLAVCLSWALLDRRTEQWPQCGEWENRVQQT